MATVRAMGALLVLLLFSGCATTETNSYKIIGSIAVTVDAAMNGWGDYVRAGKASAEDELVVKGAYQQYQEAMRVAHSAVNLYLVDKNRPALELALDTLMANKNALVTIVERLMQ